MAAIWHPQLQYLMYFLDHLSQNVVKYLFEQVFRGVESNSDVIFAIQGRGQVLKVRSKQGQGQILTFR